VNDLRTVITTEVWVDYQVRRDDGGGVTAGRRTVKARLEGDVPIVTLLQSAAETVARELELQGYRHGDVTAGIPTTATAHL
jgi:hypothetical protein